MLASAIVNKFKKEMYDDCCRNKNEDVVGHN